MAPGFTSTSQPRRRKRGRHCGSRASSEGIGFRPGAPAEFGRVLGFHRTPPSHMEVRVDVEEALTYYQNISPRLADEFHAELRSTTLGLGTQSFGDWRTFKI